VGRVLVCWCAGVLVFVRDCAPRSVASIGFGGETRLHALRAHSH